MHRRREREKEREREQAQMTANELMKNRCSIQSLKYCIFAGGGEKGGRKRERVQMGTRAALRSKQDTDTHTYCLKFN